jgi:ABC-type molybdate transport system substrate-binding protein
LEKQLLEIKRITKEKEYCGMEEKRHHKRLKLDVSIQLERLTEDGLTTYDYTQVAVTDVSRDGIGFQSSEALEVGGYYNTKIQIWTKEVFDAVIEIVRKQKLEDGTDKYGATFIGMSDTDAIKIDIYQVFREA